MRAQRYKNIGDFITKSPAGGDGMSRQLRAGIPDNHRQRFEYWRCESQIRLSESQIRLSESQIEAEGNLLGIRVRSSVKTDGVV